MVLINPKWIYSAVRDFVVAKNIQNIGQTANILFGLISLCRKLKISLHLELLRSILPPLPNCVWSCEAEDLKARLEASNHTCFSQLLLLSYMPPFSTTIGLKKDLWPLDHNFFFTGSGQFNSLKLGAFENQWGASRIEVPEWSSIWWSIHQYCWVVINDGWNLEKKRQTLKNIWKRWLNQCFSER